MTDAVDSANLVGAAGGVAAAAKNGLHPRGLLACESAAKAYPVAGRWLEIETVAWKRPHGDHSVSCAVGALQVHGSEST